jgi:hypothetical protein
MVIFPRVALALDLGEVPDSRQELSPFRRSDPFEKGPVSRGSSTLESAHLNACRACKVRVAAGTVKQPRFSSNLSTFMSNCILVVTTSERNVSGRCRTTILPQARAFAPCGYLPAWGFFIAVHA